MYIESLIQFISTHLFELHSKGDILPTLKNGFIFVCLGTGTGKLSRGHAQFDIFAFPQESFPVRFVLGKC